MKTFKIYCRKEYEVREGWGAYFNPIYGDDDGDFRIVDVDGGVVEIVEANVIDFGGVSCVGIYDDPNPAITWQHPVNVTWLVATDFLTEEDLHDEYKPGDTHDLRNRLFDTREEAEEHVAHTLRRWEHRKSFVRVV